MYEKIIYWNALLANCSKSSMKQGIYEKGQGGDI